MPELDGIPFYSQLTGSTSDADGRNENAYSFLPCQSAYDATNQKLGHAILAGQLIGGHLTRNISNTHLTDFLPCEFCG